jgi:DNA-binding FrmR family transcriptional regulator
MLNDESKKQLGTRLKRAEGQIAGVRRMVEEGHYCVDILVQLSAAQAALAQIGKLVLAQHMNSCVKDAFTTGSESDREKKIAELMDVFARYTKPGIR